VRDVRAGADPSLCGSNSRQEKEKHLMRMSKRLLAVGGMAASLVALTLTPAQASPTWYNGSAPAGCSYGALCVYQDINFQASKAEFFYNNADWTQTSNAFIARKDSSWYNNGTPDYPSSVQVKTYVDVPNTGGVQFCLDRGWGNTWDVASNDSGMSNRWVGSC
jgi:hypothetical protein